MKLAIVGSRTYTNYDEFKNNIEKYFGLDFLKKNVEIVSGGAMGVDSLAKQLAKELNLKYTEFKPDWNKHGRKAGMLRNIEIVNECDKMISFWDGKSPGTKMSIQTAKKQNKYLKTFKV